MDPAVGPQPNINSLLVPTFPTSRKRAKLEIRRACVAHESSSNQSVPSQYSSTLSRGYDANSTAQEFPKYNHYVESTVPSDSPMCGGTTILGTKCKRRAIIGSSFCKKHTPQDGKKVTSPLNIPKGKNEEIISFTEIKSPLIISEEAKASTKVKSLLGIIKVPVRESDEAVQCIGGDEGCLEIPKRHSLYCEKHIPSWLKRARNGKSRIVSKEVFTELLKECDSKEKKLQLHQACELFYRLLKSILSLSNPVPKDVQFQRAISEASEDLSVGELLTKLVSREKDRLKELLGFGDSQILQEPFEEAGPSQVQTVSYNAQTVSYNAKKAAFSGSGTAVSTNSLANAKQIKNDRVYICRFCELKFDLLPDLGRHHQAAHMGQTPTGPSLTKKGRQTLPKFKRGLNLASYNIRNRSVLNLKERIPGSNSAGAPDIMGQPTVHDASNLGGLSDSQYSTFAKLLFSDGEKTKPRPTNSEVLSIARSACCKASLQAGLEGKYRVLPEMMYFKAAKLCSKQNIIVEWHQEGFVCPRGCKPIEKGHGLPQMNLLSEYIFKATPPAPIVPSDWKMDESHCVFDSHHFSSDISEADIIFSDDISFGLEPVPVRCVIDENILDAVGNDGLPAGFVYPWESFTYVMKPVLVDDAPVLHLESSQVGCDCGNSTCSPGTCDHVYLFNNDYEDAKDIYGKSMQSRFPYDERGRIILEEGYLVYECNQGCRCSRACQNRVLQNGVQVKLDVFKTDNKMKDWAVRTREAILRGTFVCEYVGEIIDENEANKRRARYGEDGCQYFYEIDAQINDTRHLVEEHVPYGIDATTYGNVSRYITHSCSSANLASHQVVVENNSKLAHIGLYANRDIASGEELTYNFRYKMLPGDGCPCLCGSSDCRGRLY